MELTDDAGAIPNDENQNLMDAALERVKTQVEGWPVREVTRTLGVSAAQVYLARHRISALLRKEIRKLEKKFL